MKKPLLAHRSGQGGPKEAMDSKEQPRLDLAELSTVFGKMYIDPFVVLGVYDHPEVDGWMSAQGVSGSAKSVLLVQGTVRLYLTISAQEAFDILNETAKAIQERGDECQNV